MSYFYAAVFSQSPEEVPNLLAPYREKAYSDYSMGGSVNKMLKLKKGCTGRYWEVEEDGEVVPRRSCLLCDQARVGDVDFTPDPERYQRSSRFWEYMVEDQPLMKGEEPFCPKGMLDPQELVLLYGNKEEFALSQSRFDISDIVTPDGIWYRRNDGNLRFFGLDEDMFSFVKEKNREQREMLNRLITENPDLYITLVTCFT